MKLIAGLGNPGSQYKNTRHNLGFMVIEALADDLGASFKKCKRTNSQRVKAKIGIKEVMLVKPQTFMNNSGISLRKISHYYKIKPKDIWIIYDDIDLPLGKIRIRKKGSAGGHKGVASIIQELSTDEFNRFRIGIGSNREKNIPAEKYVLQKFSREEIKKIKNSIPQTLEILKKNL